jgi:hypothetical protein
MLVSSLPISVFLYRGINSVTKYYVILNSNLTVIDYCRKHFDFRRLHAHRLNSKLLWTVAL